ncbi:MAG: aspartyl-tRNA amidotransferase [Anaerolineales bacterium]|nr:GatB/YqeY domain-containing protein [Anaerolineae bacterium]PWB54148.1 MAG: aspartyl-tRNA amidotransferase [Anaerolineales bacterium]
MDLKTTLQTDLKDAMRKGQETRKSTLRMALTSIQLAEVEKDSHMDEAAYLAIIQKEVKSRRESIEDANRANRPELVTQAEEEIKVLQAYLPPAFNPEELDSLVKAAIVEADANSIRDMGKVMKILKPQLQGRATNDEASQAVKRLLQ